MKAKEKQERVRNVRKLPQIPRPKTFLRLKEMPDGSEDPAIRSKPDVLLDLLAIRTLEYSKLDNIYTGKGWTRKSTVCFHFCSSVPKMAGYRSRSLSINMLGEDTIQMAILRIWETDCVAA